MTATAAHAHRSLRFLEEEVHARLGSVAPGEDLPAAGPPTGIDFIEVKAEDTSEIEVLLSQVGFTGRGRHRTKPVTLWTAGDVRVVLNEQHARDLPPHLAAIGLQVDDADALTRRVAALGLPRAYRRTYASEQPLEASIAPDGTEVYWSDRPSTGEPGWVSEFEHGSAPAPSLVVQVDHVSLTQPWQVIDESVLFYAAGFGLQPAGSTDVASPRGLVHSRVCRPPTSRCASP